MASLEYGGNDLVPAFYPTRVVQTVYDQAGQLLRTNLECEFLKLKLADGPLSPEYFLPDRLGNNSSNINLKTIQIVVTNGMRHRQFGPTNMVVVSAAVPRVSPLNVRNLFLAVCTITLLGTLWLGLAQKKVKK